MRVSSKIISITYITDAVFIVKAERNDFVFKAGQYLVLHLPETNQSREYSIFSAENDPFIEILVKKVEGGYFSNKLANLNSGDEVVIEGPYGFFLVNEYELKNTEYLFVATGTGISPFQSFLKTYSFPHLKILHGLSNIDESAITLDSQEYNYLTCSLKDRRSSYQGRVTDWLKSYEVSNKTICYLCGNARMIDEVTDILESKGIPAENIRSEVFF